MKHSKQTLYCPDCVLVTIRGQAWHGYLRTGNYRCPEPLFSMGALLIKQLMV